MEGLASSPLVGFVATTDLVRARDFYGSVLGLPLIEEDPVACVLDAHGTPVRVTLVGKATIAPYTVLGWAVADIAATIADLAGRGVVFERFGGMEQDVDGVWVAPSGARIAWFKDPEGNVLSLTQA